MAMGFGVMMIVSVLCISMNFLNSCFLSHILSAGGGRANSSSLPDLMQCPSMF